MALLSRVVILIMRMSSPQSPSYFFDPHTPSLIARTLPSTRFIVLMREPVTRAYSRVEHYIGLVCAGVNETDVGE